MTSRAQTPRFGAALVGAVAAATLVPALLVGAAAGPAAANPAPSPSPYTKPSLGPVIVKGANGSTPLPDIKTDAFVIADASNGDILAERNLHTKMRPASTLKTLTMLTLMPRLKSDSVYTATEEDTTAEGSRVGMIAGQTYTVNDLLHGLALPSGNDAASGLAGAYGGWDKTVAAMNEEARRVGANDTNAMNPSGLDQADQLTSVHDIAQIFRADLQLESFRALMKDESYKFPGDAGKPGQPRETFDIYTQDRLATHDYPGIVGGKTGYTKQAGRTFVVAAERDGHTLVAAMFGIGGNTEETSKKLLDWGFANLGKVTPTGQMAELPAANDVSAEDVSPPQSAAQNGATPAAAAAIEEGSRPETSAAANGGSFLATMMTWLLVLALILGITVAALRFRAVRRSKARRAEAAARRQVPGHPGTWPQDPADTRHPAGAGSPPQR